MFLSIRKLICLCSAIVMMQVEGKVEYEIIQLCPAEYTSSWMSTTAVNLSESGYVIGWTNGPTRIPVVEYGEEFEWAPYINKGFIFRPDIGFKIIPDAADPHKTQANFVNNNGLVAGTIFRRDRGRHFNVATLYNLQDNKFEELLNNHSGYNASVIGVSESGKLLMIESKWNQKSSYLYDSISKSRNEDFPNDPIAMNGREEIIGKNWFYSEESGLKQLGSLDPYGRWSVTAQVQNENGAVAGTGYDLQKDLHGFVWDLKNGLVGFKSLGGDSLEVNSLNNIQQAVGISKMADKGEHAFLYDRVVGTVDLGTFGGRDSNALDVNDLTQIVGYADNRDDDRRAFIWDQQNGLRDLNRLIPSNTGWVLESATKINNQGYIIGEGVINDEQRAFLLIPKRSGR